MASEIRTAVRLRAVALSLLSLLGCVVAIVATRPTPADAARANSACATTKQGASRACSSRKRSTRARHKSKRSKTGHRQSQKTGKGGKAGHGTRGSAAPAAEHTIEWSEAACDDGSAPHDTGGDYACDDGSTPECEDGSRPALVEGGAVLACSESGSGPEESSDEAGEDALASQIVRVETSS